MAYRTHITLTTPDGKRFSPDKAVAIAPAFRSFAHTGTRHGVRGLWLEAPTKDGFRYKVSRVEQLLRTVGLVGHFAATNAPSLAALHTTLHVSEASRG